MVRAVARCGGRSRQPECGGRTACSGRWRGPTCSTAGYSTGWNSALIPDCAAGRIATGTISARYGAKSASDAPYPARCGTDSAGHNAESSRGLASSASGATGQWRAATARHCAGASGNCSNTAGNWANAPEDNPALKLMFR